MIQRSWNIPDFEDEDQTVSGRQSPTLVSLHFIRSALRRRWPVVVLSPILGLLAAAAFLLAFPASHDAKASLVLAHDPQVEPERAMATDVSLLRSNVSNPLAIAWNCADTLYANVTMTSDAVHTGSM